MKRILFFLCAIGLCVGLHAQQQIIYCGNGGTSPCTNPGTQTNAGDPAYTLAGKTNANFTQLYGMFGPSSTLQTTGVASFGDVLVPWSGTKDSSHCPSGAGTMVACSGGSSAFNAIASGTNTTAAMVVGTGASLSYSGSGSISALTAVALAATPPQCSGGQFSTGITAGGGANCATPSGSGNINTSGTITSGNLPVWNGTTTLTGTTTVGSNAIVGNIGSGIAGLTPAQAVGALNSASCNAQTVSYQLVLGDANGCVTLNSSSATVLTLPPNSTVNFPVGTLFTVQQLGTGAVTITLGGGVSVNQSGNLDPDGGLGGQYGFAQYQQTSTNVWNLIAFSPGNAKFTVSGGTCNTAASTSGGATGGTITEAASGTVNACTMIITPGLKAKTMWVGTMADQTQNTLPVWMQTAQSTTTITFTLPAAPAASDVMTFQIKAE